jgi:hypothetical protein
LCFHPFPAWAAGLKVTGEDKRRLGHTATFRVAGARQFARV